VQLKVSRVDLRALRVHFIVGEQNSLLLTNSSAFTP